MNDQAEAVSHVAALFRAGDPCPVVLLGAGASFRTGVPMATDAVKHIARPVYAERELRRARRLRRPHSALGYLTPAAFAANLTATGDQPRNPDQIIRSPVANPAPPGATYPEAPIAAG